MKITHFWGCMLLLLISACEFDNEFTPKVTDLENTTWFLDHDFNNAGDSLTRVEISFLPNQVIEDREFVIDKASGDVAGFTSKSIGTYILEGDVMTISYQERVTNSTEERFSSESDLDKSEIFWNNFKVGVSLNKKENELTLKTIDCPINALCIDKLVYKKVE